MHHIGFIVEQALGHVTHGQTLRQNVERDRSIVSYWALPRQDIGGLIGALDNWTVKAGLQSRRAIRQMRRDALSADANLGALFFHTQVAAVLAQDWMRYIPSVVSLDATPKQYDALGKFYGHAASDGRLEAVKFWFNRRCYERARHLVTWSQWAKDGLVGEYGISAEKITVIPPGVNVAEWQRPAPRTLKSERDPLKVLFVGGNLNRKGGNLLLEACQRLNQSGQNIELHLVTRDTVAQQANVFIYNNMQSNSSELRALYHASDVFCLPTYGDCLPMVLSEAAAAELPSISTNVAAIPELVHDQETGFIVPTGDVCALEQALRRLIENPQRRLEMGAAAHRCLAQAYDAERNATRLVTLLKQIADRADVTPGLVFNN